MYYYSCICILGVCRWWRWIGLTRVARCLDTQTHTVFFGDAVYNVCRWWRWVRLTRVAVFVHIDFTTTTASITLSLTPCLPLTVFIHLYSILPWVLSEGLLFSGDFIETLPPLHWGLLFSSDFIQTLPPLGTQWRASIFQRHRLDSTGMASGGAFIFKQHLTL